MNKKILINNGQNNCCKAINQQLLQNLSVDYDLVFNPLHGKLFHAHQTLKPKMVVWSLSEYTQEFHDYITEHHKDVIILLLVDVPIKQKELIDFIKSTNVKIILNETTGIELNNIAKYSELYEDSIFFDKKKERNDKTIAILSGNNEENHILHTVTYPDADNKIIAMGNPQFDSPINLGLFNLPDLANILNTFKSVIDITGKFKLASQACQIPYISLDGDLKENLENNVYVKPVDNLDELSYKYFVNKNILPFIRKTI